MQIGILGGTGPAGLGLAARLASVGMEPVIGSRSAERAAQVRDQLVGSWPGRALSVGAADNAGAAACDLVVVATPWDGVTETVSGVADSLAGKVVISMANAVTKMGREFTALLPARGSIAASVQAAAPGALVAAAMHHLPAKDLGDIDQPIESDVLVCSDHKAATAAAMELVGKMPALRALDAGPLSSAAPIEAFTA
ncbi:MAG: NADPH-dependent F420 reductase, partial [Acidobacteria bacterium]|nr:NADPH-dependent F420 reductase [Acidobacteriota bacterium]